MTIKSNPVRVNVVYKNGNGNGRHPITPVGVSKGKPPTLECVQLAIQNAERLMNDSKSVSIPTRFALLEIGLEEIAKAGFMYFWYYYNLFKNNPSFFNIYMQSLHIDEKRFEEKINELDTEFLGKFFGNSNQADFWTSFNNNLFFDHDSKIKFLSFFIKYIREISLPVARSSSDRSKTIRDIFGRYVTRYKSDDLKEIDKTIDNILSVDVEQLSDMVKFKEYGLYLNYQNDIYISPSSRNFETETLEALLSLLIASTKNEVSFLIITLRNAKENKRQK